MAKEEIPNWYLNTVKRLVLAPFAYAGVALGDIRISMKVLDMAQDVDIDTKCNVFRFAIVPMSEIEIAVPWDSELSCKMKSFMENLYHYI